MIEATAVDNGVKERLEAVFDVMQENANINPTLTKLLGAFFTNFLNNTDEGELVELLETLRDELLPFVLDGQE